MIEWLQTIILRPIVEILLLIPIPLRYSVAMLLVIFLLVIIPVDLISVSVRFIVTTLLQAIRRLLSVLEGLYAHKLNNSSILDITDRFVGVLIRQVSWLIEKVKPQRRISFRGWRPRKRIVFGLVVTPLVLWLLIPPFQTTIIGRTVRSGYEQIGRFEGWAITGQWQTLLETVAPDKAEANDQDQGTQQLTPTMETSSSPVTDTVYIVQKGDILRVIAQQQGVRMQCIIQANSERYADFNPDSLSIGMELYIPRNPECAQ